MKRRGPLVAATCIGLAAASLLIPSAPTTDPWGWIVWGREVAHLQLSTAVGGAPSWKPLPVLFTVPLSLLGGAAPDFWILVARAAGLLGLVLAFRLGARLAGRAAGVLAAAGLLLSAHWVRGFLHGYTEPLATALLLGAVERHWAGRPRQALLLAAGVSLARPEALPLALLYGLLMWRRGALGAGPVAALALAVPALWILPDWLGSGRAFHGGQVAGSLNTSGAQALVHALVEAASITPIPLSLAAVAAFAVARRVGDRRVIELSVVASVWVGLLVALMLAGYPASPRFFALPATLLCVLGAAGTVWAVEFSAPGIRPLRVAALLTMAASPAVALRAESTDAEARAAVQRAGLERNLGAAIARAGPRRLRACGVPVLPQGMGWLRGDVAWHLGLPLNAVRSVPTTGNAYLRALSRAGAGRAPREVTVQAGRPVVFLDPFARTRLRSPGLDLDVATHAGKWRVLLPDSGCGARPPGATRAA